VDPAQPLAGSGRARYLVVVVENETYASKGRSGHVYSDVKNGSTVDHKNYGQVKKAPSCILSDAIASVPMGRNCMDSDEICG